MEPLTKEFYLEANNLLNYYKQYEDILIARLNFIFESIIKATKRNISEYNVHIHPVQIRNYIEHKTPMFDWRICQKDNWYCSNAYIKYEDQTINIFEKFPSHWLDWNFEDELEDCLNDYNEEQRKIREEQAKQKENDIRLYNEAVEKYKDFCNNLSCLDRTVISSLIK